jgi:hypothetical protein
MRSAKTLKKSSVKILFFPGKLLSELKFPLETHERKAKSQKWNKFNERTKNVICNFSNFLVFL